MELQHYTSHTCIKINLSQLVVFNFPHMTHYQNFEITHKGNFICHFLPCRYLFRFMEVVHGQAPFFILLKLQYSFAKQAKVLHWYSSAISKCTLQHTCIERGTQRRHCIFASGSMYTDHTSSTGFFYKESTR